MNDFDSNSSRPTPADLVKEADRLSSEIDRVEELTSALIDEQATDADRAELESLLLSHDECRGVYISLMQLHVDLHEFFNEDKRKPIGVPSIEGLGTPNMTGEPST